MKILVTTALVLLSLGIQAEELKYVEGEELVKYCQKDSWDCIAPAAEIVKLQTSLKQNSPIYLDTLAVEQAGEIQLANTISEQSTQLSNLVLSKASKKALVKAQTAIAGRVSLMSEDQKKQTSQMEISFKKISEYFEEMTTFSETYYANLATITSPEVRQSYVYSSHNQYLNLVRGLSQQLKAAKKASSKLLETSCGYKMSILNPDQPGYCGDYTINPFLNFEGLKFTIFNKEGRKSLPLKAVMVKKNRRYDALYSKEEHKLTLHYFSWQSWGWYGDSGTASPSKDDVNKVLGFVLLK